MDPIRSISETFNLTCRISSKDRTKNGNKDNKISGKKVSRAKEDTHTLWVAVVNVKVRICNMLIRFQRKTGILMHWTIRVNSFIIQRGTNTTVLMISKLPMLE